MHFEDLVQFLGRKVEGASLPFISQLRMLTKGSARVAPFLSRSTASTRLHKLVQVGESDVQAADCNRILLQLSKSLDRPTQNPPSAPAESVQVSGKSAVRVSPAALLVSHHCRRHFLPLLPAFSFLALLPGFSLLALLPGFSLLPLVARVAVVTAIAAIPVVAAIAGIPVVAAIARIPVVTAIAGILVVAAIAAILDVAAIAAILDVAAIAGILVVAAVAGIPVVAGRRCRGRLLCVTCSLGRRRLARLRRGIASEIGRGTHLFS